MCIFHRWIYIVHTNVSLFAWITYICNANDCNKKRESEMGNHTFSASWDHFTKSCSLAHRHSFFRRMQINFPIRENSCNSNFWIAVDIILMVALVAATTASRYCCLYDRRSLSFWLSLALLMSLSLLLRYLYSDLSLRRYLSLSPKQLIYKESKREIAQQQWNGEQLLYRSEFRSKVTDSCIALFLDVKRTFYSSTDFECSTQDLTHKCV